MSIVNITCNKLSGQNNGDLGEERKRSDRAVEENLLSATPKPI